MREKACEEMANGEWEDKARCLTTYKISCIYNMSSMSKARSTAAKKEAGRSRRAAGSAAATAELQLHSLAQARALLQPLRVELLRLLAEPRAIGELAELLSLTPQKLHYHVKALEAAGLVQVVAQRRVRALTESLYQASAQSFAPGPELLALLGGGSGARDQLSRGYLLALAEDLLADAARLAQERHAAGQRAHPGGTPVEQPTLSINAQVELGDPRRRSAFLAELQAALQALAEKYGAGGAGAEGGDAPQAELYKLVLACYPQPPEDTDKSGAA